MGKQRSLFCAFIWVNLSLFISLNLDTVFADQVISSKDDVQMLPSVNSKLSTESSESVLPKTVTSESYETENEKLHLGIVEKTLKGQHRVHAKGAQKEANTTEETAPSKQDSSSPVDYFKILASYMRPEVFHKFIEGLNKTLDEHTEYSHPNFTNANTIEQDGAHQHKVKYPCMHRPAGNRTAQVRIVNNTELLEVVSYTYSPPSQDNSSSALGGYCAFVMFYAPWCKFSAEAAAAFNAIGRAFPDLEVLAIDAFQYNSLNTRYGIFAVPNVLLFHNNKPVMRFNYSQRTFDVFSEFIRNFTGLEPNSSVQVSDEDAQGPLPSVATEEPDYALWLSWLLLLSVAVWFLKQRLGSAVMDRARTFAVYARQVWRTGELYDQVGVHDHQE